MRYILPILEVALLLYGGAKPAAIPTGVVVSCHDGDTLRLSVAGDMVTIRLAGIDAPELKQPGGRESRDALAEMSVGQRVQWLEIERDRYGRSVAYVWLAGQSIGQRQLRAGWAWAYENYPAPGYQRLEDSAHAARLGIWGYRRVAVEPWVWRKNH